MLLQWLAFAARVNEVGAAKSGKLSVARAKAIGKSAATLVKRGGTAGYRVDLLIASGRDDVETR